MRHEIQTWEIRLLTPLHVGDGEELVKGVDYVAEGNRIKVYDPDAVIQAAGETQGALSERGTGEFDLARFLARYARNVPPAYELQCPGRIPPRFRRFIKDAWGRPYLPGSTLKGALNKALWSVGFKGKHPSVSKNGRWDSFKKAVNELGGKDSYHQFIRPLQVGDTHGLEGDGSLRAEEVKIFNLRSSDTPGWKSFGKGNPTMDDFNQAKGNHVEALGPGATLVARVELSGLLNDEVVHSVFSLVRCNDLASFEAIAKAVNQHSLEFAKSERDFFLPYGRTTAGVSGFYTDLIKQIGGALEASSSLVLRLAWGGGWRGMTGNWMDPQSIREARRQERLGKRGSSVFPKTRRLALNNGAPSLPLGWVKVTALDKEVFRNSLPVVGIPSGLRRGRAGADAAEQAIPAPLPKADPGEERARKLQHFKENVTARAVYIPGEINSHIEKINNEADRELQKACCLELLESARRLPKKRSFDKALVAGKHWAKSLKALCEEVGIDIE